MVCTNMYRKNACAYAVRCSGRVTVSLVYLMTLWQENAYYDMIIQRNLSAQIRHYQQPFIDTIKHCGVLNLTIFSLVVHGLAKTFPEMHLSLRSDGDKLCQLAFRSHHFIYTIFPSIKHLFNQYFTTFCNFDPAKRGYCGLLYSTTST